MAWEEVIVGRNQRAKLYKDDKNPNLFRNHCSLAEFHYEDGVDSGNFSKEINLGRKKENNSILDGWVAQDNAFHYRIGALSDRSKDGWVGFGGRQGQNWVHTRLSKVGFLTSGKTWTDLGGEPNYNRSRFSQKEQGKIVGPYGEMLNVGSSDSWDGIWSLGLGSIDLKFKGAGSYQKEDIVVDSLAREHIMANLPETLDTETWFGFLFEIDWNDVPKIEKKKDKKKVKKDDEFDDSDGEIDILDSNDNVLAQFPIDYCFSGKKGRLNGGYEKTRLEKRFFKDENGSWMMLGIRVDQLKNLLPGDLVFDPTYTVSATNRDGYSSGTDEEILPSQATWGFFYCGYDSGEPLECAWIWSPATPQGATVTTCTVTVTQGGDVFSADSDGTWYGFDVDTPTVFASETGHRVSDHNTRTTANVDDDDWADTATHTSPSLVTVAQEIIDRTGYGETLFALTWRSRTTTGGWYSVQDYTDAAGDAADLLIEWTVSGSGNPWYYYAQQ